MKLFVIVSTMILFIGSACAEDTMSAHMTASTAVELHSNALRNIMRTLYLYNPEELKKSTTVSAEEMVQWTFEGPFNWKFDAIRKLQGTKALELGFDQSYRGDRILPLVTGVQTMLIKAYGGETEFRFTAEPNPEYLHRAALNIEHTLHLLTEVPQHEKSALVLTGEYGAVKEELQAIIDRLQQHARYFSARSSHPLLPPGSEESAQPAFFNF